MKCSTGNLPAPLALSQGLGGDTAAMLVATGFGRGAEYADSSLCTPRSACLHFAVQSLHFFLRRPSPHLGLDGCGEK